MKLRGRAITHSPPDITVKRSSKPGPKKHDTTIAQTPRANTHFNQASIVAVPDFRGLENQTDTNATVVHPHAFLRNTWLMKLDF